MASLCLLFCILSPSTSHSAERPFGQRFVTNAKGDIHAIGNTLLNTSGAYVNVDGLPRTNSSSANLSLPSGSTVQWAGLYWAGHRPNNNTTYPTIKLKTPASGGYINLTAPNCDLNLPPNQGDAYLCYADVTGYVRTGGSGWYTAADIVVSLSKQSGNDPHAGWGLIVAFENEAMPLRNLTVYDGFYYIGNNSRPLATLTGFTTPLNGPVGTTVGFLAGNGRAGSSGDGLLLSDTALSDPQRGANNFFVSRATDLGVEIPRNPQQIDTYGWDVGRVNASGILANNATAATIEFTGGSDKYFPYAFSFATEIYVPIIAPNITKIGTDVNGGLLVPGDILRYEIGLANTGYDTGTSVVLTDPIPAHTTYVPGSLRILTGANAGAKSDGVGDDQAEYCAPDTTPSCSEPQVVFRLGTGANAANGGNMPHLASTSLIFDVSLNPAIPAGTVLTNTALISYSGQTLGASFAATSSLAAAAVYTPPAVSKSFSPNPIDVGGTSTLTIQLTNSGPNQTTVTGVSLSDSYPPGLFNTATPNPSLVCSAGSSATLTGGAPVGNSVGITNGTFPPNGHCTITVSVTSSVPGNHINQTSEVTSANTGSAPGATAVLSVGNQVIAKSFSPNRVLVNEPATTTFTITNPTVVPLTGLTFTDNLVGLQVAAGAQSNTCGGLLAAAGSGTSIQLSGGMLAASSSCTVTVPVTASVGGYYANTTGPVDANESAGYPSNTAYLTVVAPPVASKSFSPPSVSPGASSTLNIVLANPSTTASIAGVAFTDIFPAGLIHTATPNPTLTCTPGTTATLNSTPTSIGISGGSFAPGGNCTVRVNVTANTVGNYVNSTGPISTSNGGTGTAATATFNVSNLTPPGTTVGFSPASLPAGQNSTMTVTLTNPNGGVAINGATFTLPYPPGLVNANPANAQTTCGGTATASAGGNSLVFTGGTIPAGGSCAVSVPVATASGGTYYVNTGSITTSNAAVGGGASGNVTFNAAPIISKSFATNPVGAGGVTQLRITLTNPGVNTVALNNVAFTDPLPSIPSQMVVASPPALDNGCGGTMTGATASSTSIAASGITLAANTSCTIAVNVTAVTAGNYLNTTSAPTSSTGGTGLPATATLAVGQPGIAMAFGPASILYGNTTTLAITLSNPTSADMTGASFTNTYPASIKNAGAPNAATTCGGTAAADPNGTSIALTGGTIPASGSCTVTVTVRGTASVTNTIPGGGLTIAGGASNVNAASGLLNVTPPPIATKSFAKASMPVNDSTLMTIIIANPTPTAMTGVSFNDDYPGGGTLRNAAGASLVCSAGSSATLTGGGINGTSVGFNNGSIGANSNCTITVNVTATATGSYNNSTGTVNWSMGGVPGGAAPAATAVLTVLEPFTFGKSFNPASISVNDESLLIITLSNPNSTAVTGVAFTDSYNTNIVNANPSDVYTSCGGTASATPGTNVLSLTGGTIPAASGSNPGTCQVTVYVTSSAASTGSGWANTLASVSSGNAGTNSTAATAYLSVVRLDAPTVTKSFSVNPLQTGLTTRLTVTLTNPNAMPILGAGFTDTYPVQIINSSLPGAVTSCPGGTVSASAGGGTLTLFGATIPVNGCTASVEVRSSVVGDWTNTLNTVTSANAEPAAAASATLTVIRRYLEINKEVDLPNPLEGTDVNFAITLRNHHTSVAATGIIVEDTLPPGLAFVSASASEGTVTAAPAMGASGNVAWEVGNLAPMSDTTLVVAAKAACGSFGETYINSAAITAYIQPNPDLIDNNATAAVTPTAATPNLTVVKMANGVVNGATAKPGQEVTYTVQVLNTGCGKATSVILDDHMSPYTAWGINSFGPAVPFQFVEGAPPSGLALGTPVYSNDNGATFTYPLVSEGGGAPTGYDGSVTNWRIPMANNMAPGGRFTLHYKVLVK